MKAVRVRRAWSLASLQVIGAVHAGPSSSHFHHKLASARPVPEWDGLTTGRLRFTFGLDDSRVRQVYNSTQHREPVVRNPSW